METEAKLAVPYSEFFTCCHKYMLCDILSSICYQPHIWQDQHHGIKGVCVCGVASFPHPTQIIIISNTEEKVGGGPCSNKAIMCAHICESIIYPVLRMIPFILAEPSRDFPHLHSPLCSW